MVSMNDKISEFLNSPKKNYSVEESKTALKKCGILNQDGTIKPEYKEIVVKLPPKENGQK